MTGADKIYLVVPARNEEKRIAATLMDYLQFFPQLHLVVVLTKCSDNTEEVVKDIQAKFPQQLEYITAPPVAGNSKGQAVRYGLEYVWRNYQPQWLGFIDADNSVSPTEFNKLWQGRDGFDVVISSRYLPDSYLKERDSFLRIIASYLFRKIVQLLFGLPWQDTQCGGKIYRGERLAIFLDKLQINDMTFDVEMLYYCQKYGLRVKEVPIVWRENIASTISTSPWAFLLTSWQMFLSLLLLRIRFWQE